MHSHAHHTILYTFFLSIIGISYLQTQFDAYHNIQQVSDVSKVYWFSISLSNYMIILFLLSSCILISNPKLRIKPNLFCSIFDLVASHVDLLLNVNFVR